MSLTLQSAELGEERDALAPFLSLGPTPGRSIVLENQSRVARPRSPLRAAPFKARVGDNLGVGPARARIHVHPRSPWRRAQRGLGASPSGGEFSGSPVKERTERGALSSLGSARRENPALTSGSTSHLHQGLREEATAASQLSTHPAPCGPLNTCRITSPGARLSSSSFSAR